MLIHPSAKTAKYFPGLNPDSRNTIMGAVACIQQTPRKQAGKRFWANDEKWVNDEKAQRITTRSGHCLKSPRSQFHVRLRGWKLKLFPVLYLIFNWFALINNGHDSKTELLHAPHCTKCYSQQCWGVGFVQIRKVSEGEVELEVPKLTEPEGARVGLWSPEFSCPALQKGGGGIHWLKPWGLQHRPPGSRERLSQKKWESEKVFWILDHHHQTLTVPKTSLTKPV